MSEVPWFSHIPAPIGVLDDRKLFDLPVSIAKTKFVEACLHNVCEVGGSLRGFSLSMRWGQVICGKVRSMPALQQT